MAKSKEFSTDWYKICFVIRDKMKQVKWIDERGKIHISLIRDTDSDDMAQYGIPQDPPDISEILEHAKIELHNALVESGIIKQYYVEDK